MGKRTMLSFALISVLGVAPAVAADEAGAKKAAESWLAIHDAGRYGETWDASAKLVQDKVPREQWEKAMRTVAESFGKLESRSILSAQPTNELPGMPDGQYVVFTYQASFANKSNAVETVIPMLEDGTWKVMTYRVR